MTQNTDKQDLILLRMGIKAGPQKEQIMKIIKSTANLREDYEKAKNNLKTMTDEDQYLKTIISSHQAISSIPENSRTIVMRDNSFHIKAINSEEIQSLTQRAFFNSFNLQRVVLNDLEEENIMRTKSVKPVVDPSGDPPDEVQQYCICGKVIPGSTWVQCAYQKKCRGSSWYHVQCAGFDGKDVEKIQQKVFICDACKRQQDDEDPQSLSQIQKKIKK